MFFGIKNFVEGSAAWHTYYAHASIDGSSDMAQVPNQHLRSPQEARFWSQTVNRVKAIFCADKCSKSCS